MKIETVKDGILLVPMHVEAIIVGKDAKTKYADLDLRYRTLKKRPSGAELESAPFAESGAAKKGVHLHWLLPSALTHGEQKEDGGMVIYPAAPNRWLVTRLAFSEITGKPPELSRKSWLIESDILSKDIANPAGSPVIGAMDEGMPYRYIGTVREFGPGTAVTSGGAYLEQLTAVCTGTPYFAAYYPQCRNVFGFYDALKGVDAGEEDADTVHLTYMVAGWYETPDGAADQDPLAQGMDEAARNERLRWQCADSLNDPLRHTVCHGLVSGLWWQGPIESYPSGVPYQTDRLCVTAGDTTDEALAALVGSFTGKSDLETALHSLFIGGLREWDDLDGEWTARRQMHESKFQPQPAETVWRIQGKKTKPDAWQENLMENLAKLSHYEQSYETKIYVKRQQLYTIWRELLDEKKPEADAQAQISKRLREIQDLQRRIGRLKRWQDKIKDRLENILGGGESLLKTAGQRYWQPNTPLLMLEGAAQSSIYKKLEEYLEGDVLPCRTAAQIVTEITARIPAVKGGSPIVIRAADVLPPAARRLPACLEELAAEALLFSSCGQRSIAYKIAAAERESTDESFRRHVEIKLQECLCDARNLRGTRPNAAAVHAWQPSFHPLILEWSVLFYPDPKLMGEKYSLEHWRLAEEDFEYVGPELINGPFRVFRGRTVLSPHASDHLERRLEEHLPEGYAWLKAKVGDMRILSQVLSGLNEQFIGRTKEVQVPVWHSGKLPRPVFEAIAAQTEALEKQRSAGDCFFPVRAGFMLLEDLSVIDSFGRKTRYEIKEAIRPQSMRREARALGMHILLPPRVLAPLRLKTAWDAVPVSRDKEEKSPVYGFLWANLIDSALQIYTAAGKFAGSLQIVYNMRPDGKRSAYYVSFRNPPGETRGEAALFAELEPDLRAFVRGLYDKTRQEPMALYEFLHVIDESMWNIHAGGLQANSDIFAYLGHPVALAGFSLRPELKGSYPCSFGQDEREKSPLQDLRLEIRIGARKRQKDGAIGYYVINGETDYTLFHAVGSAEKTRTSYIDYEPAVYATLDKGKPPLKITALMSPFGSLHLVTGLLPVKQMKLPEAIVKQALENIYLALYCGPFLTPKNELRLFLPKAMEKAWTFLSYEKPGVKRETGDIKPPVMEAADLKTRYKIREGWLKLNASAKKGGKPFDG